MPFKTPESKPLVLAAIVGAGRSLARKRAGGALPLPPGYPRARPPAMRKTRPSARGSAPPAGGAVGGNQGPFRRFFEDPFLNDPASCPCPPVSRAVGHARRRRLWNPRPVHLKPAKRSVVLAG